MVISSNIAFHTSIQTQTLMLLILIVSREICYVLMTGIIFTCSSPTLSGCGGGRLHSPLQGKELT